MVQGKHNSELGGRTLDVFFANNLLYATGNL